MYRNFLGSCFKLNPKLLSNFPPDRSLSVRSTSFNLFYSDSSLLCSDMKLVVATTILLPVISSYESSLTEQIPSILYRKVTTSTEQPICQILSSPPEPPDPPDPPDSTSLLGIPPHASTVIHLARLLRSRKSRRAIDSHCLPSSLRMSFSDGDLYLLDPVICCVYSWTHIVNISVNFLDNGDQSDVHPVTLKKQEGCSNTLSSVANHRSKTLLPLYFSSSLNYVFSTSSVETSSFTQCASFHHPGSLKPFLVSHYMFSSSPSFLLMCVDETLLSYVSEPYSYSPSILWMDVYDFMLSSLDKSCRTKFCTCSTHLYPSSCHLALCSPWSKLDPKFLSLGDMHYLVVCCSCVFCRLRFMLFESDLRSFLSSLVHCLENHCHRVIWLVLGLEAFSTDDDPFSVCLKGSTLVSAAVFKIVKPVFVAASITEVSSVAVILTFDCVILLLRSYGVEIQGRHYIICYLGTMIAFIICLFYLRVQYVAAIVIVLMALSSTIVNNSSFGDPNT